MNRLVIRSASILGVLTTTFLAAAQTPLGTGFTYQGRLENAGSPANGLHDLRFRLYDALSGGAQVGATLCADNVNVADGLFSVPLDFGNQFAGQERFLAIDVRADTGLGCGNGTGFVSLSPRQALTAAPNALFASNADLLDGLDSTMFLQSVPVPLTLSGTDAVHILRVQNASTANSSLAVFGLSSAATGGTYGVAGQSNSTSGRGVIGFALAGSGSAYGGEFLTTSTSGRGAFGWASAASGSTVGLYGLTDSTAGRGVVGEASSTSAGNTYGVHGLTASTNGNGVVGQATAGFGVTTGLYGVSDSNSGRGVYGLAAASTGATSGVYGLSASSSDNAVGVFGSATGSGGVTFGGRFESTSTSGIGVFGFSTPTSGATYGVYGRSESPFGIGVYGVTTSATGGNFGVYGQSDSPGGFGVYGIATAASGTTQNAGVYGQAGLPGGWGVYCNGNMAVVDNLFVFGTKDFRIDHPDDPENKYLLHYCHEGSEPQNVYNGVVRLDGAGGAVVELPRYFAKINKDPRYTLTGIGAPMPMLHVAVEIDEAALSAGANAEPGEAAPLCSFRIAGGAPGAKVSWEVKAVRNDRWVQQHGAPVEVEKHGVERGMYQHPELYGQPPERGLNYDAARERPEHGRPSPATPPEPAPRGGPGID